MISNKKRGVNTLSDYIDFIEDFFKFYYYF